MDKINWKVRIKNKMFWIAIIPAVILLIQTVAGCFGLEIDLGDLGNRLIDVVNAAFILLSVLGIVADPTTAGMRDSHLAMTYEKPKDDRKDSFTGMYIKRGFKWL